MGAAGADGGGVIQLRDYQDSLLGELRAAFSAGARAPLVVLPTGGGKTVMFSAIAAGAAAKGRGVLILVHRRELLDQTSRALDAIGVPHGLIAPGVSWRPEAVQVASVQTLVRRLGRLGDPDRPWAPDLIVVDEAHHATRQSAWGRVLGWWGVLPAQDGDFSGHVARCCGWTATPERLDGQGLGVSVGGPFDALLEGPSTSELVMRGYLARPVVYRAADVDFSGVASRGGDYASGEAAARVDVPRITGDAVEQYRKRVQGAPAIAFCHSVAHAEHVAEQFRAAGYAAASIDGALGDRERRARIRDLGAGALAVLTSCDIVSEGTDIPVVSAAILLRRTQSLCLYLQQVGRALRLSPGKERAVILDHVGNTRDEAHGLPDLVRAWSLDAAKRSRRKSSADQDAERAPKTWTCDGCGAAHRPAPVCPVCGYCYPAQAWFEWRDGDLHLVESAEDQYRRYASGQRGMRVRSLAEWEAEARKRGFKPGWAKRCFEWQQLKIRELRELRGKAA